MIRSGSLTRRGKKRDQAILDAMVVGPLTAAAISFHVGLTKSRISLTLRRMNVEGKVEPKGLGPKPKRGPQPVLWGLM